jgi:hypothetical protein
VKTRYLLTGIFFFLAFGLMVIGVVDPVNAQQGSDYLIYLPVIFGSSDNPAPTPTPTLTATPSPTPAPLVPESIFGVNTSSLDEPGGLTEILNIGASWTYTSQAVSWASIEPVQGQRNWDALSDLDKQLQNARNMGLRVVLTVEDTPEWAHAPGLACGPVLPEKLPALAAFLHDLVQHYSATPYQVKTWELWPEPDVAGEAGCWGDPNDPYYGGDDYAVMLAAVYPQIKAADPEAQVLVGSLRVECDPDNAPGGKDCSSSNFLEGILQASGEAYFDGIGFHAVDGFAIYDLPWGTAFQYSNYNWHSYWHTTGPVVIAKAHFIQSLLTEYGITGKALYNTQSALLCASCQEVPVFETAKAGYVAEVYAASISLGLEANLWESLSGWQNSGLMSPQSTPLPAYQAFQFAREKIGPAEYVGEVTASDIGGATGVQGYKFQAEDGSQVWLVWSISLTQPALTAAFAASPTSAWNALGEPLDLSNGITIRPEPVWFEWIP